MKKEKAIWDIINGLLINKYVWYYQWLLKKSEFWTEQKILTFQYEQLKKIIDYAYKNVPYYNKLFNENSFHPSTFKQIDDIKRIPFLTKDIIRENSNGLIASNFKKKRIRYCQTGGSTGKPMAFYADKIVHSPVEWTFMKKQWRRVGYNVYDKCVVLQGDILKNIIDNKRYWRHDFKTNWLIMSSFHMTESTITHYLNRIRKFQPKFIIAYPSVLYILALYIKKNRVDTFYGLKALLLGSENLYQWQREFFEEVFKVRVFSWYGHGEHCILAGECEFSTNYHSFPQYGFTEIISRDGEWCTKEGEEGELVGTSFTNYAFPFIRYRTQDVGVNSIEECGCGRNYKLIKKISGRLQDFFIDNTGNPITFTCSDEALYSVQDKINSYQYVQNEQGQLILNLDIKREISKEEFESIKNNFIRQYPRLEIEIKVVDHIPRSEAGKFRYLVQNIPLKALKTF